MTAPESVPDTSTPVGVEDPAGGMPMHKNPESGIWVPGSENVVNNVSPNINVGAQVIGNGSINGGAEGAPSTPRSITVVETAPEEPQTLETPIEEPAAAEQPSEVDLLKQEVKELKEQQAEQLKAITELTKAVTDLTKEVRKQQREHSKQIGELMKKLSEPNTEPAPEPEPGPEATEKPEEPAPAAEAETNTGGGGGQEVEPETEPSIEDELEIEPEDDTPDETGNAAPGRFRSTWNRIRDGYIAGTYHYVTGENVPPHEQGDRRRSRLLKRLLGAAAVAGTAIGLYYLFTRGGDSSAVSGAEIPPPTPPKGNNLQEILNNLHPDSIHAHTPDEFQRGVIDLLDRNNIDVIGFTPAKMEHMNKWMESQGVASGVGLNASGDKVQHVIDWPSDVFTNPSGEQAFVAGDSGTGQEGFQRWVKEAARIGVILNQRGEA